MEKADKHWPPPLQAAWWVAQGHPRRAGRAPQNNCTCDLAQCSRSLATFRSNMLPPASRYFERILPKVCKDLSHHIPEDSNHQSPP
jgi:hypothetical protein